MRRGWSCPRARSAPGRRWMRSAFASAVRRTRSWPSTNPHQRNRGLDRARSGLSKPADRGVAHRLRDLSEQRDVLAVPRLRKHPLEDLLLPLRADPARHALAARLVLEKGRDAQKDRAEVGGIVEDDNGA